MVSIEGTGGEAQQSKRNWRYKINCILEYKLNIDIIILQAGHVNEGRDLRNYL